MDVGDGGGQEEVHGLSKSLIAVGLTKNHRKGWRQQVSARKGRREMRPRMMGNWGQRGIINKDGIDNSKFMC